jgi:peptide/nickel transport system permease protein
MEATLANPAVESTPATAVASASPWQLMWWRFTRHRLAVFSLVIVTLLYLVAAFCEFFAPYDPNTYYAEFQLTPPQRLRFFDVEGNFSLRPFVYERTRTLNPDTLAWIYSDNPAVKFPASSTKCGDAGEWTST